MDEKILKRLGYYLLMEEYQKKDFKKMLCEILETKDIKKVVEKNERQIKKNQEHRYFIVETMIREQLQELKESEKYKIKGNRKKNE